MRFFLVTANFRDDFDRTYFKHEIIQGENFPSKFSLTKRFYGSTFDAFVGISGIAEISEEDAKEWGKESSEKMSPGDV